MSKPNKYIRIESAGYGHKRITVEYRGKQISGITTNMPAVDDYNSEEGERDGRELKRKRGYTSLRNEVVRKHLESK
jgi:hypothetical protein